MAIKDYCQQGYIVNYAILAACVSGAIAHAHGNSVYPYLIANAILAALNKVLFVTIGYRAARGQK